MAKKTDKRTLVTLACTECKEQNYRVSKSSDNTKKKLMTLPFMIKCLITMPTHLRYCGFGSRPLQ